MGSQDHGHAVTGRCGRHINISSLVSGYSALTLCTRIIATVFSPSFGVDTAMMSSSYTLIANLRSNGNTSVSLRCSRSIYLFLHLSIRCFFLSNSHIPDRYIKYVSNYWVDITSRYRKKLEHFDSHLR